VAEIVRTLKFQGGAAAVLTAIRSYQDRQGDITPAAPTAFLNDKEAQLLTGEDGKFRVSLYKALPLFQDGRSGQVRGAECG
jgi:hypothetical protein